MYVLGVDLGSRSTKCVLVDKKNNLLAGLLRTTDTDPESIVKDMIKDLTEKLKIKREEIKYVVSTGYGREGISMADKKITEITCHAAGAHFLYPKTRTVIDIGGQDSKVISINYKGKPVDFAMNDKCAAGTGKFLEMMSRTLDVPLEKLGEFDKKAKKKISINSICTVFAESEVISLMAEKANKEDIIRGLHRGIADRTAGLLERVGVTPEITMTGGVAKNTGVVKAIEKLLNVKLNVPSSPELIGAFGAAIKGMRKFV